VPILPSASGPVVAPLAIPVVASQAAPSGPSARRPSGEFDAIERDFFARESEIYQTEAAEAFDDLDRKR
jgi:hypothetical protein